MESIHALLEGSTIPALTALLLGLLTAISPCPLATNIAAVAYIAKRIESPRQVVINGLLYALGRVVAYTLLGILLIFLVRSGAGFFTIQKSFGLLGEKIIGPALVIIGLFMLFGERLNLPKFGFQGDGESRAKGGRWGSFWLGVLFAMAFCPSSGVLYFGVLIPLSAAQEQGYLLPGLFALATGIPVVAVAWILGFGGVGIGKFYNRIGLIQRWLKLLVALLFVAIGAYYTIINLF